MVGSYNIRLSDEEYSFNSSKITDIAGKAVASDAIWAFYGRFNMVYNEAPNDNSPTVGSYSYGTPDGQSPLYWVSNHDRSYNILFTDGSVKTFSDSAMQLYKRIAAQRMICNGYLVPNNVLVELWENYFDPMYAQD